MNTSAIDALLQQEQAEFERLHPQSHALFLKGQTNYLYGAPSHWMRRWAGGFPIYVVDALGARLKDVDGIEYVDFCLGDTGGMCGHGVPAVTEAVQRRLRAGATFMLPTADAEWVGAELQRRFGLPYWDFTTSATDANRAVLRIARMVTGRDRILVFNGCYHGSVEEAHVALADGEMVLRNQIHPNGVDHQRVSRVIEFNDPAALERALAPRDVACVLTEPCMTNYGLIEPQPGYLNALRELTRKTGTLLVLDETHTISAGPGGYTRREKLEPDFFVIGKAIGGGIPVGLFGVAEDVAQRLWEQVPKVNPARVRQSAHLGFGGTLAGSALQVAAVRAVLSQVLTDSNFEHMINLASSLASAARQLIDRHRVPWHIVQSGARVETMWTRTPPLNATEVARARNGLLEALLHVYALNRGIVITPFHSMLLISPATTNTDCLRFNSVFEDFCKEVGRRNVAPGVPA